jgi:hypothetical protein
MFRLNIKVIKAGTEMTIKKKSSLFQFEEKYCLVPSECNLIISSTIKRNVIKLSAIETINF